MKKPIDPFENHPTMDVARSIITGRKRRQRASKQTPAERRRVSATWSARIGVELKRDIQELVQRTGRDNGYVGRALLRYALDCLESGKLIINEKNEIVPGSRETSRICKVDACNSLG